MSSDVPGAGSGAPGAPSLPFVSAPLPPLPLSPAERAARRADARDALVARLTRDLALARDHTAVWRREAAEDFAFAAGDQWSEDDRSRLADALRPVVTFNRIAPVIDTVAGAEVANRQEVRYMPRERGDAAVNEMLTAAAKWVRDLCDAEDEESDAFLDAVVCGMGWTNTRLDFADDPEGRIVIERIDPRAMLWDPAARKRNLGDARFVAQLRLMPAAEVRATWPEAVTLHGIAGLADAARRADWGLLPATRHDLLLDRDRPDLRDLQSTLVPIVEVQFVTLEPVTVVPDPLTGALIELPLDEASDEGPARDDDPDPSPVTRARRRWQRAFLAGDILLDVGPAPCRTGFTFRAITARRDPSGRWYGLTRAMKDPQRWANKFFSQILHVINTGAKGGLLAEEDAFVDPRRAEEEWARPDSITLLRAGGLGRVQPRMPAALPPALAEMMSFAVSSIRDVTGINLELMGLADRNQPGVLEMQRRESGMTVLAPLFDALRRYRKEQGRVLLAMIQDYLSDGRLIRVDGEGGSRFLPLLRDPAVVTYDVIVDEAPTAPNARERTWAALLQLLPVLQGLGAPVLSEVVAYAPLPESLRVRLQAALTPPPPPPAPGPAPAGVEAELAAELARVELAQKRVNVAKDQAHTAKLLAEAEAVRSRTQTQAVDAGLPPVGPDLPDVMPPPLPPDVAAQLAARATGAPVPPTPVSPPPVPLPPGPPLPLGPPPGP